MERELKVSAAAAAAKRTEVVALKEWQQTDGSPLCVLCTDLGEKAVPIVGSLPGGRPKLGFDDAATAADKRSEAIQLLEIAADLIEQGASLLGPDGEPVQAFYFSESARRSPHSLDGRQIGETDLAILCTTLLRLSGYLGGAAEASFRREKRSRMDDGAGTVAVLP